MRALRRQPLLFLALLSAVSISCARQPPDTVRRPGRPDVVNVPQADSSMNEAMEKSRATIQSFIQRLDHPPATQTHVSLKVRFEEPNAVEHIWLGDVSHEAGSFSGRVDNEPLEVRSVRMGQRVTVSLDRVSDWLAIDSGRLVGGYTIRVLYDRMAPDEKASFLQSAGFSIE